jgi:hypothetical protein
MQSLAPTNPRGARMVGGGLIHKEGLCPSSGDINSLMIAPVVVENYVEGVLNNNYNLSNQLKLN